jgi:uncharacterized protein (TIGR02594 family)
MSVLKRGARGAAVRALQRDLIRAGHALGRAGIDGDFGRDTEAAVKAFQRAAGRKPSGVADDALLAALRQIGTPPLAPEAGRGEPRWLAAARRHLGEREVAGRRHNPLILRWWMLIRAPFTDDETPWCAGFVGGVLEECGIRSSRSAAARSYLRWGMVLPAPRLGCIVVFERGPRFGHVGFVAGTSRAGHLMVLGGNQGDAVSIAPFARGRVLGFRWPATEPLPDDTPLPLLASSAALSRNEA